MEPEEIDEEALMRDAYLAERNRSMRDRGRQIGGVPGAMVAGLMIALRDIYETPKRDNGSVVVDSPSEPHDVDRDGLDLSADEIGAETTSRSPPRPAARPSSVAPDAAPGPDPPGDARVDVRPRVAVARRPSWRWRKTAIWPAGCVVYRVAGGLSAMSRGGLSPE